MTLNKKITLLIMAVLAMSACAPKHPRIKLPNALIQPIAWRGQLDKLREIESWNMQGRIASSASWGFSGALDWQQVGEKFSINASGPLGIGAVKISGTPKQVTIKSGKDTLVTDNPAVDLQHMTGWPIPVEFLRYWVLSVPVQNRAYSIKVADDGWPETIVQAGWRIEYHKYQEQAGFTIPRKISVTRNDLTVKLILSDWLPEKTVEQKPPQKTPSPTPQIAAPLPHNALVPVSDQNTKVRPSSQSMSANQPPITNINNYYPKAPIKTQPAQPSAEIINPPVTTSDVEVKSKPNTSIEQRAVPVSDSGLETLPEIETIPAVNFRSSPDNPSALNLLERLTLEHKLPNPNQTPNKQESDTE